jgi:hypothetical protein
MKKIFTIMLSLVLCIVAHSQDVKKNTIGTHFAYGASEYFSFPGLTGAGGYTGKGYYSIGIDYSRRLSDRWEFCSGLTYAYHNMRITGDGDGSGRYSYSHKQDFRMITIPLQMKYHFWKYFYVNGGLFVSEFSEVGEEELGAGLGIGVGAGAEYEFKTGIMVTLSPYLRWNVTTIGYYWHFYNLLQQGVAVGIGYKF